MVYQSPIGARDLLPIDVASKHWIEDRLVQVFDRWGYHQIITSTLERMDTILAGGAIQESTVIQVQDGTDERLGLRPELTASIARTCITRMSHLPFPQRIYYKANVFRKSTTVNHGGQQEFYQAGVELLGSGGVLADLEILLLLSDCMNQLGHSHCYLIIAEAGLTNEILSLFPPQLQNTIRYCIANLDRISLQKLSLSPSLHQLALTLFDLRGTPAQVLERLAQLEVTRTIQPIIDRLKSLTDLLNQSLIPQSHISLILDLSLIQTFDYYTGIIFKLVSPTAIEPIILAEGGRYDNLLSVYHPQQTNYPGIGFCFNIENLYRVLQSQLPQDPPSPEWLVVPIDSSQYISAINYAQILRSSSRTVRAQIYLETPDFDQVRQYAKTRGINQIAWIKDQGTPEIEIL